jgi:Arc/MetJ-type ribon-helix-helix transcriptional regulator
MTVHIRPELEAVITEDLKSGIYESAEEYIGRAIQLLHEERLGPLENRAEISAQIEEGWVAAERGELIDGDDAVKILRKITENGFGSLPKLVIDGFVPANPPCSQGC